MFRHDSTNSPTLSSPIAHNYGLVFIFKMEKYVNYGSTFYHGVVRRLCEDDSRYAIAFVITSVHLFLQYL